ncbi:MAG TPA: DNA polymerase III subunit gamma/tau [Anaerolineae bacterium]|nr:DNA polymerase III subunit gamma/tau [Anaerolineae bacterium]
MAAQALYLKYRPRTFDAVVGQEHVTRTLRNALAQGRLRHAYLFCGPRGTGKTTTARLLAKAVNCLAPQPERPCNACTLCTAINEGRLLDLIEIDAASNRGIDEIRDIREKIGFRPNEASFKVYVLDEAHMLTDPAFNALLKTLEEPPPHVIFVLVTTDPQKIPATITSRCQRFDFRRVGLQDLVGRLRYIATQEDLEVEQQALELIAHQSTGAVRDAISLLDQMTSYGDKITLDQVQMVLGTVAGEAAGRLVACLAGDDVPGGLDVINRNMAEGADPRQFAREVVEYLRGLLLIKEGAGTHLLNATAEQAAEMEALAARITLDRLLRAIRLFNDAATDLKRGFQSIPQLALEMAFVESLHTTPGGEAVQPVPAPHATPSRPPAAARRPDEPPAQQSQPADSPSPPPAAGPAEQRHDTPQAGASEPPRTAAEPESRPAASDGVSIAQVTAAWDQVLAAVRRRNPTSEAALRSGCRAVEVNGGEVVITFPYPVLRDKLAHPQRRMEIQEALSDVVGIPCSVKLVLAAEYPPSQVPQDAPAGPYTAAEHTPNRVVKEAPPAQETRGPAVSAPPTATAADQDPGLDPNELKRISRWAEQRGGHVIP